MDEASQNIFKNLFKFLDIREKDGIYESELFKLSLVDKELVFLDDFPFKEEYCYIFLSKHKSESNIPSLTAHFPGNIGYDKSLGGREREVAYSFPSLLQSYMKNLFNLHEKVQEYKITLEPTHHGPTQSRAPLLFIELGSGEKNWKDERAGETLCEALIKTLREEVKLNESAIALGGPHYSEKFTKFLIKEDLPLSHIIPKYSLEYLDGFMMEQITKKSIQPIKYALLDWKGLGKEKDRIIKLIKEFGLEIIKI
ncbi:hypothetical protein HRbin06_00158 [archaeon HR06]|nr:hypothetical protein HRbin06_00158 [archaeon HR06]